MTYIIYSPIFEMHDTGPLHPERKERLEAIKKALLEKNVVPQKCWLEPVMASDEELCLCHERSYVELVQREVEYIRNNKVPIHMLSTGDVVISSQSYLAALCAAGAVVRAVDLVMQQVTKRVFCPVRPPGHHATKNRGMGFCIFNNVAVGVRYAQKKYQVKKVLIIDWDVHHGNGTQDIFEEDPSVFYFSTHQEGIYPKTGARAKQGTGEAKGTKCNLPILVGPEAREELIKAYETILEPAMEQFQPELVFISAGFDAHRDDPLSAMELTDEDFAHLTDIACRIANRYAQGRVISVLEGGYDLKSLAASVVRHVEQMNVSL